MLEEPASYGVARFVVRHDLFLFRQHQLVRLQPTDDTVSGRLPRTTDQNKKKMKKGGRKRREFLAQTLQYYRELTNPPHTRLSFEPCMVRATALIPKLIPQRGRDGTRRGT